MDIGFAPPLFGCFGRRHGFANAAPSVIEFTEFRIAARQI
jgi:hypothetical protein